MTSKNSKFKTQNSKFKSKNYLCKMTNKEIGNVLKYYGKLLEIHGENQFKTRSYSNASFTLSKLETQVSKMSLDEIASVKGFGKAIVSKIEAIKETGSLSQLETLMQNTPKGILELSHLKGLGAKKLRTVWQELAIESPGELLYACNENRLTLLKGFGEKTQENVRQSLLYFLQNKNKFHYAELYIVALEFIEEIKAHSAILDIELTGAIRRKSLVLETIELISSIENKAAFCAFLDKQKINYTDKGELISGDLDTGHPFEVYFIEEKNLTIFNFVRTANEAHLEKLKDLDLSKEYKSENEIYESMKLAYILPECREGIKEIEIAKSGNFPELITFKDIKGVIHNHSTYSDGANSVKEMAEACITKNYEYLVMSDHSQTAVYASGLKPEDVKRQQDEIDELNKTLKPFKIYKSIESDILSDGSLDYSDAVLKSFDLVIASIHSSLKMDEEKAMMRLINAIENPYTTILGHLTGRLILSRKGYPVNHTKIIDACAANNVAIELNANPYRLDMDYQFIPYAMEKGVYISINPDAHSTDGIDDIYFGVEAARKGMLTSEHCLNTKTREEFDAYLNSKN